MTSGSKKSTRWPFSRLVLIAVGCLLAGAVAAAASALAANSKPDHRHAKPHAGHAWRFSIFTHHATVRARRATAGGAGVPQGAVFARVSWADGLANELYAWHRTPQEDCIVDVEGTSGGITTACSPSDAAEAKGISWAGKAGELGGYSGVNVVVMVPDGVSSVQVTDGDGSSHTVPVVNNFADYAASSVTEMSYRMPDGEVVPHHYPF